MLPTGFPQDLLTRTCTRWCKDTGRISPGPLQELLTRTCIRSCKGLWRHLIRISTRSSAAARADLTRSWCKNLPRASHKSFHTSTSKREEFSRISTRARLCENFQWKNEKSSPGALKDFQKTRQYFTSAKGRFPKRDFRPFQNVVQFHQILPLPQKSDLQEHLSCRLTAHDCQLFSTMQKVTHQLPGEKHSGPKFTTCAVDMDMDISQEQLRSWNAHWHLTWATLGENLKGKCLGPESVRWSNTGL